MTITLGSRTGALLLGGCLLLATAGCTSAARPGAPSAGAEPLAAAREHAAAVLSTQQAVAAHDAAEAARQRAVLAARRAAVRTAALRADAARSTAARAAAGRAAVAAASAPTAARRTVAPARAAAVAPARTTVQVVETPAQRGARVLASLHYPWQALGYRVVFLPGRAGYLGLTDAGSRTVTIWVRSSESDLVLAHTVAHELGHVLDFTRGNPVRRARYLAIRGLAPQEWFGCSGCTDFQTAAGDWAEVFAQWVAGPGDFRSLMAGAPTRAQLTALDALFALP